MIEGGAPFHQVIRIKPPPLFLPSLGVCGPFVPSFLFLSSREIKSVGKVFPPSLLPPSVFLINFKTEV